ncbi:MAG: hypothetical protein WC091_17695 [Sulfuricellaceae bacterium]
MFRLPVDGVGGVQLEGQGIDAVLLFQGRHDNGQGFQYVGCRNTVFLSNFSFPVFG